MSSAKRRAVDALGSCISQAVRLGGGRSAARELSQPLVEVVNDIVEAAVAETLERAPQPVEAELSVSEVPSGAMPWRLQIAATLLGGRFANDASDFAGIDGTHEREESEIALHWADALIEAHERSDTA